MATIAGNVPDPGQEVQSVTPLESPRTLQPRMDIQSNPNEFGAQIGQATEKAGGQAMDVAKHYADIYADSTARDATTKQSMALSTAEEQYKQLKGNDAVGALKDFQQKAQQIAQQGTQGLSIAAAKMHQDDMAREVNGAIFRAGSYAGSQAQDAHINSIKSSTANNTNQFAMNVGNPTGAANFQSIVENSFDEAKALGHNTPDAVIGHNGGEALATGIRTQMATDPAGAQTTFDNYINKTISVKRSDANGNMVDVSIPVIDAAHRASISSEMHSEWNRQSTEAEQAAKSWSYAGVPFDENDLRAKMARAGKEPDFINSEVARLNTLQNTSAVSDKKYTVGKTLDNARSLALDGKPLSNIPDDGVIDAAFPHEPSKAQDVKEEFKILKTVSDYTSNLPTKTREQAISDLTALNPVSSNTILPAKNPLEIINKNEGFTGKIGTDSNGANVINGVNEKAFPHDYASIVAAYSKGKAEGQSATNDFFQKNIIDKYDIKSLPVATQAIVADGLVNHGDGTFGQKLLAAAKAGDTPQQLIDMRRKEYQRLADSDDDFGSKGYSDSLKGWNNRLDSFGNVNQDNEFSYKQKLYSQLVTSTQKYYKELDSDPAGKIIGGDQIMNGMLSDAMKDTKDPAKFPAYIDAMQKRQETMQVPEMNRSVLPASVATSIASSIQENPETAPFVINQWAKKSGDSWPEVYKSLVTQGKLPAYYQSVAQLGSDPLTERDGMLLAKWRGPERQGKDDADLLGSKAVKDIKDNVNADPSVQQLLHSLALSGSSKAQVDDVQKSIESLSMAKSFYDQKPNATAEAISSFTSKYEFMPNGGARVPTANMESVSANAQVMIRDLEKSAVAPEIAKTGYHGLPNEKSYFDAVRGQPTWITVGNGVRLIDPYGRSVMGKDGKPLSIPFNAPLPVNYQTPEPDRVL